MVPLRGLAVPNGHCAADRATIALNGGHHPLSRNDYTTSGKHLNYCLGGLHQVDGCISSSYAYEFSLIRGLANQLRPELSLNSHNISLEVLTVTMLWQSLLYTCFYGNLIKTCPDCSGVGDGVWNASAITMALTLWDQSERAEPLSRLKALLWGLCFSSGPSWEIGEAPHAWIWKVSLLL